MHWLLMPFRRAFDYSGRSGKKEFASFLLVFLFAIPVGFATIYPATQGFDPSRGGGTILIPVMVYMLIVLVPAISLLVRRLHDVDWSGWWLLVMFVPIFWWMPFVLIWLEGTMGPNRFGPDPRIKEQPNKRSRQLGY